MKLNLKKLISIFALIIVALPSFAWGQRIHAAIAYIGEQHLTPKARKTINELLDGKSMVYYASWLDEYRKEMLIPDIDKDGNPTMRTIPHSFRTDLDYKVVKSENKEAISIICKSIEVLKDYKDADDSTRLAAMQCLIHLVGDIHCPGHVSYADKDKNSDDKRYDATKVKYMKKDIRMHTLWDARLVDSVIPGGVYDLAYQADRASKKEIKEIQKGTPYEWGQEIIDRTRVVWTVKTGDELTKAYGLQHRDLALDQIQRAGLRLAKVMNDLFK